MSVKVIDTIVPMGEGYPVVDASNVSTSNGKTVQEEINDIPKKISELENDENFVNKDVDNLTNYYNKINVDNLVDNKVDKVYNKGLSSNDFTDGLLDKLNKIESGAQANVRSNWNETSSSSYAFILNKPTSLAAFSNDPGFITRTEENLLYYYTKSEVDELMGQAVGGLKILIVSSLPSSNIQTDTIYLVRKSEITTDDIYDEYMYISNSWERIGSTAVDLKNYYTITQIDNLLLNKIDKESGKGLSTNDFTNDLKLKLEEINIPTKLSDLNNDAGFITSDYHDNSKQDVLISGTNVKTINGKSILGSGNIVIEGGSGSANWGAIGGTITDQTDLQSALDNKANLSDIPSLNGYATESYVINYHDVSKQDTLISGTTIKTINNVSLLGNGDISIPKGDKGDTGSSGVYVGAEEPTDPDITVWIQPNGTPDEYISKAEVERMINEAVWGALNGSY